MTQLAQRLCLYLADPLASDLEGLANFFERVLRTVFQSEAHLDHALFPLGQAAQHGRGLLLEIDVDNCFRRRDDGAILDEVTEMRIFFLADRRLERDGLLRDLEDLADLRHRDVHALCDLFRAGFTPKLLVQLPRGADELVDGLDHVRRDADGAGLIRDRARDRLTDPPGRVGRELVAAAVLELVHGLHQADVALLDEVEELESAVGVLLRDGHDEAKVSFDELLLRLFGGHVALNDLALGLAKITVAEARIGFELLEIFLAILLLAPILLLQLFRSRGAVLLLQRVHLTIELPHVVDGLGDTVDQVLALHVRPLQLADDARHSNALAAHAPAVLAPLARLPRISLAVRRGDLADLLFELLRLL